MVIPDMLYLTPGDGEGLGVLACCSPWDPEDSHRTGGLNNNNNSDRWERGSTIQRDWLIQVKQLPSEEARPTNMCSLVTETFLVVVQSPSPVRFSATPWIAARQAFPCLIFSGHLPKVMSIASVMPPPLMPSSPSAVNLSQHRGLSSESSVHFR